MSRRFEQKKSGSYARSIIISVAVFLAIAACFWCFSGSLSNKTDGEEKLLLEKALTRGITHCYALEGVYPESLDYLKKNYGLVYDEEKFYVDYQPLGEDIMPSVTVLEL